MTVYQQIIKEATGCNNLEDIDEIEEIMRHDIFHSTLDWQTREQLKKAAKEGYAVLKELRKNAS